MSFPARKFSVRNFELFESVKCCASHLWRKLMVEYSDNGTSRRGCVARFVASHDTASLYYRSECCNVGEFVMEIFQSSGFRGGKSLSEGKSFFDVKTRRSRKLAHEPFCRASWRLMKETRRKLRLVMSARGSIELSKQPNQPKDG
jgi:hypothetical protein